MTNGVGIIAAMLVYTHATHTAESKLRPIDGAAIAVIIFGLYMTMSAESHMGNADAPLVGAQLRLLSALHVHLGWAALTQNRHAQGERQHASTLLLNLTCLAHLLIHSLNSLTRLPMQVDSCSASGHGIRLCEWDIYPVSEAEGLLVQTTTG